MLGLSVDNILNFTTTPYGIAALVIVLFLATIATAVILIGYAASIYMHHLLNYPG